jgi:hypothetical protein
MADAFMETARVEGSRVPKQPSITRVFGLGLMIFVVSGLLGFWSVYPMAWIGGAEFVFTNLSGALPIPMIVFFTGLVAGTVIGTRWLRSRRVVET